MSTEEQLALWAAINTINESLSGYGVALAEVAGVSEANIRINIAMDSAGGSATTGVLGYAVAGEITLLGGWNWYGGADENAISHEQ